MPPKAKFTREEVIEAALKIVMREGIENLTARALAGELGSSARPVFTVFSGMDEVQCEVQKAAHALYNKMVEQGLKENLAFKGVGKAYIRFAIEYPKLFQMLFMREKSTVPELNSVLGMIDENYGKILQSIESGYGLDIETAKEIYRHLWIYSHGIAVLLATNVCCFTADEISGMLSDVFSGVIRKYKSEGIK